jgi:nucleoside-diphosphate-sugar epimerase
MNIAVIGATGKLGRRLVARLLERGASVTAVGRSAEKLAALPVPGRVADCNDGPALRDALSDSRMVISCAFAGTVPAVIAALPKRVERVVLTGSTRRFTQFPDSIAKRLIAAETMLTESGHPGVLLYPTMICGEDGKNNVQRIAAYIRRFGVVPLPQHGRALVQPVYVGDLAACLEAALFRPDALGPPIVVGGKVVVPYSELVEAVARAIGRRVRIVSVPAAALMAAAPLTRLLPGFPTIGVPEVRRLLEDKNFDITDMRRRLGVEPMELDEMLARTFA